MTIGKIEAIPKRSNPTLDIAKQIESTANAISKSLISFLVNSYIFLHL
jgi:hypothetical protein